MLSIKKTILYIVIFHKRIVEGTFLYKFIECIIQNLQTYNLFILRKPLGSVSVVLRIKLYIFCLINIKYDLNSDHFIDNCFFSKVELHMKS